MKKTVDENLRKLNLLKTNEKLNTFLADWEIIYKFFDLFEKSIKRCIYWDFYDIFYDSVLFEIEEISDYDWAREILNTIIFEENEKAKSNKI